jgi:hypothetical protein
VRIKIDGFDSQQTSYKKKNINPVWFFFFIIFYLIIICVLNIQFMNCLNNKYILILKIVGKMLKRL